MLNNFKHETQQRFSIRKLTVGAASVMIGLLIFGTNPTQVHAETVGSESPQTEVVQSQSRQSPADAVQTNADAQGEQNSQTGPSHTSANTQRDASQPADVNAQHDHQDNQTNESEPKKDQALIPAETNTTQPDKINGQGNNSNITNVPTDGTIVYDYSISAKDKKNGQTQTVHSAAAGKDNHATLVDNNAEDVQANFTLKNISNEDQFIGNSEWGTNRDPNKFNNDEAALFINAWDPEGNHSLKISGDKAANVVFINNDTNQVINDNALPVYYLAKNGTWYTYEDMVHNFGASAIPQVTQIGFKGIIPGKTTATMNVPLIIDTKATNPSNQITTKSYNANSIYVKTYQEPKQLWTMDEVKNDPLNLSVRNDDGTYTVINDSEFANLLPKVGDVVQIINSGNLLDPTNETYYVGGEYIIKLPEIQAVLQKYGYSVNPLASDLQKLMVRYTYSNPNNPVFTNETALKGHNFYIEVRQILSTKNDTFEEGSTAAQNWNAHQDITGVYHVIGPVATSTGYRFENVAVDPQNAQVVSIVDSQGRHLNAINGQTPAGVYRVTVATKMNGSSQTDMFIEKTFTVTITPKAEVKPEPEEPNKSVTPEPTPPTDNNQPTQPVITEPTDNDQPTTPQEPENNQNQPVTNDTVEPKGEKVDREQNTKPEENKTVAPKGEKVDAPSTKKTIPKNLGTALERVTSEKETKATSKVVKTAAAVTTASKKSLPQTGEKQTQLGLIGLGLVAAASYLGLVLWRKRN